MSLQQPQTTATRRLLEHIRSTSPTDAPTPSPEAPAPGFLRPSLFNKEQSVVGVRVANGWMTLAQRRAGSPPLLEAVQTVKVPETLSLTTPEGAARLRQELARFVPNAEQTDIWISLPEEFEELRHYRIPKVGPKDRPAIARMTALREKPFNEAASLFDFREEEEILDKGVPRIPLTALIADKNATFHLRDTLKSSGVPPTGITSGSVYAQNLFASSWLSCPWEHFGFVNIGEESTHIEMFNGQFAVLSRTIKTGLRSLATTLQDTLAPTQESASAPLAPRPTRLPDDLLPLSLSEDIPLKLSADPESSSFPDELQLLASSDPAPFFLPDAETEQPAPAYSYEDSKRLLCASHRSPQETHDLLQRISQPLTRLARQIERTADYFRNTLNMPPIQGLIVFAPGGCLPLALKRFESLLGLPCIPLRFDGQSSPGALIDLEKMQQHADDTGVLHAIGLALSDARYTPNAVLTYQDQQSLARQKRLSLASFGVTSLLLLGTLGLCGKLFFTYTEGQHTKALLERTIASWEKTYSPEQLRQETARLIAFQGTAQKLATRRTAAALLVELSTAAPSIRLTGMRVSFTDSGFSNRTTSKPNQPNAPTESAVAVLTGTISGDVLQRESQLAEFLSRLEHSPMVLSMLVEKQQIGTETLSFVATLKLV